MIASKLVRRAKQATTQIGNQVGFKGIHRAKKGSQLRKDAAKYVKTIHSTIKGSQGYFSLAGTEIRKNPPKRRWYHK